MTTTEIRAERLPELGPREASQYKRTVITTGRRKEEPKPAEYKLPLAEVKALSFAKRDAEWYARRRVAAWKIYDSLPMPTLNDEAWRRTDIRPFKWNEIVLPHQQDPKVQAGRVPAALLKPLVGKEQGGQLVAVGGKVKDFELQARLKKQGVLFVDFLTATKKHPELLKRYLGKCVP